MFRTDGIDCVLHFPAHFCDLVPRQFHHRSGLKLHKFSIRQVPNSSSQYIWQSAGYWLRFDPFVVCVVRRGGRDHLIGISSVPFAHIYDSIRLLGSVDGETQRYQRYIAIHQAYESVVQNRDVDLTAIRHALAHPPNSLTNPATVRSLHSRFGGPIIDLHDYQHRKEFFLCLAKMLIETDKALSILLDKNWHRWGKLGSTNLLPTDQRELPCCDIIGGST